MFCVRPVIVCVSSTILFLFFFYFLELIFYLGIIWRIGCGDKSGLLLLLLIVFLLLLLCRLLLLLACGTATVCAHVVSVRRVGPAQPTENRVKHSSLAAGDKREVEDIRKEPEIRGNVIWRAP